MGYIQMRRVRSGYRYTVYDTDGDKRRSLGTYATEQEATAALEMHDARTRRDVLALSYRTFVEDYWREQIRLSPTTKAMYQRMLRKHVLPVLGRMPLKSVGAREVQGLLDTMEACGASAFLLFQTKAAISSSFRPLVEDGILERNPASRARIPAREEAIRKVLAPAEVKAIMAALTSEQALMVSVLIDSGVRYGEVTELRVKDVDRSTGAVIVSRSVADIGAAYHPDGRSRFLVKQTKSGKGRVTSISPGTLERLSKHVRRFRLGDEDLLFPNDIMAPRSTRTVPEPVEVTAEGFTEPNEHGTQFPHGTISAYTKARCRCAACRAAMREYGIARRARRARRREPGTRSVNTSGHLPKDVWGRIWRAAVAEAGIGWAVRTHDLRHANATWMLKGGMDLHTVKERLGHHSITVTEGYLHRLQGEDAKAVGIIAGLLA